MKIYFGRPQANIVVEFYMQMQGFRDFDDPLYENLHLSSSEFFYDEFKFQVAFDLEVIDSVMHINVLSFNMAEFNKYTVKDLPLRNELNLTAVEYN